MCFAGSRGLAHLRNVSAACNWRLRREQVFTTDIHRPSSPTLVWRPAPTCTSPPPLSADCQLPGLSWLSCAKLSGSSEQTRARQAPWGHLEGKENHHEMAGKTLLPDSAEQMGVGQLPNRLEGNKRCFMQYDSIQKKETKQIHFLHHQNSFDKLSQLIESSLSFSCPCWPQTSGLKRSSY